MNNNIIFNNNVAIEGVVEYFYMVMKRCLITISILLVLCVQDAEAQPYQSIFGNDSTEWVFIWYNLPGAFRSTAYIEKDTAVNGVNYKKLNLHNNLGYKAGLIREDTTKGHVWYRDINIIFTPDDTVDRLIFRFDLKVGDTFTLQAQCHNWPYLDTVDSVKQVNGLKHIYFRSKLHPNAPEHITFVEGVGANYGIIPLANSGYAMQNRYLLCSYKDGMKTGFENVRYEGACEAGTDIAELNNQTEITVYPVPVQDVLNIKNSSATKIHRAEIYNYTGVKVKSIVAQNITNVDVSELPTGYYILKLYSAEGVTLSKSFVK
ncbi:MAG: T9SS type A sorting domain-containing protein [Chitinophagales bacterium]|nr:T9SS type A sorting domain-containing protein [Chitinophagaceae bacterium]MCB9064761.1 T9SS type A sorting domain-containing protein [Chitinophagales bacterium]